jgi:hypothetical protein
VRAWLYVTTRLVRWMDGYPAVDRDGCGRWRDVCGVVGGRVVQPVRELTAHACVCGREYVGCSVVWWVSVVGSGHRCLRFVWVRMCVRWYAGRDGMVRLSLARHGLLCGC